MRIIDFNGEGKWSLDAILERYTRYCRELGIDPSDLSPCETMEGDTKWIYPVMDEVIKCIDLGDAACKLIGIEFIEEDQGFPFGKILKANTARALRRQNLSEQEKDRIRKRVIHMLVEGNTPREYREYARLLKKVGLADYRWIVKKCTETENPYVLRFAKYLLDL